MNKLVLAFYEVGQFVSRPEIQDLLKRVGVDESEEIITATTFEKILKIHRTDKLLEWRRSYGFTPKELSKFRECCRRRGCDDVRINIEAVLDLTDDLGLAPVDQEHREALMKALMRVDRKGTGFISFEEFVLLLRHLENQKLRRRNQEEGKAAKAAGLDAESVQQFREAFQQLDEAGSGYVPKKAIREMLKQNGAVLTPDEKKKLEQIFKQIEEKIIGKQANEFTFAQFLWVLRGLDNNGEI